MVKSYLETDSPTNHWSLNLLNSVSPPGNGAAQQISYKSSSQAQSRRDRLTTVYELRALQVWADEGLLLYRDTEK